MAKTVEIERVTLGNLGQGAVEEQFQDQMAAALANIADLNTDAKEARKIILEISIHPTQDRRSGAVSYKFKGKFAPPTPPVSILYFGIHGGERIAQEHVDPRQHQIDFETTKALNKPVTEKKGD